MPLPGQNVELIPDNALGIGFDGAVLSEYLQLFVLADRLAKSDDDQPLFLFQYRKFLTPKLPRAEATKDQIELGFFVPPGQAASLYPEDHILSHAGYTLTGTRMQIDMAGHYARSHYSEDFVALCLAMHESALFSRAEILAFARSQTFIVSPALGLYRPAMLIEHMRLLRAVWLIFQEHFYVPRPGTQRRVGGFLLERLHSYLVQASGEREPDKRSSHWYRVLAGDRAVGPAPRSSDIQR